MFDKLRLKHTPQFQSAAEARSTVFSGSSMRESHLDPPAAAKPSAKPPAQKAPALKPPAQKPPAQKPPVAAPQRRKTSGEVPGS
jgi:hypothetical protein